MRRVSHSVLGPVLLLGMTACSLQLLPKQEQALPEPPPEPAISRSEIFMPAPECGGRYSAEQRVYLELVHNMVKQGQNYAALAHLDQMEKTVIAPQGRYLRAEALRRAGRQTDAEPLYRELSTGCMAGYGLHGLGLLAAEAGQLERAEDYLRRASRERPVDAETHNDYGMVLLLRGQRQSARQEFLTAAELDRKNPLPVENLIVLMLAEKQEAEAQDLAAQRGVGAADMARLAQRAQRLNESSNAGGTPAAPSSPQQD